MIVTLNATSLTLRAHELEWKPLARGRVGMYALIAAEAAIFTIFVVAYLFYVGKSLSGPIPREVLSPPIFYTICLLSSSLTIHFASRTLRVGKVRSFGAWLLLTIALGAIFLLRNSFRVAPPHLSRRPDGYHQFVRDHLLFTGRATWLPCRCGRGVPLHRDGIHIFWVG